MDITINGIYIDDRYNYVKSTSVCALHKLLLSTDYSGMIEYIYRSMRKKNIDPIFLNPYHEIYLRTKEKYLESCLCLIILINIVTASLNAMHSNSPSARGVTDRIQNGIHIPVDFELEINKLKISAFDLNIRDTNTYFTTLLRTKINNFIKLNDLNNKCECSNILLFTDIQIHNYKIHGRKDLLYEQLSEINADACLDIDEYINNNIIPNIQNNFRKFNYQVLNKNLEDCPKFLWTDIFEKYCKNSGCIIYIDSNNQIIDLRNNPRFISYDACHNDDYYDTESDDDSFDDDITTTYLSVNEDDPDPIYKINFVGQDYCILCDGNSLRSEYECEINNGYVSIYDNRRPHICNNICNLLVRLYSQYNEYKRGYQLNVKNLRYSKNNILELYTGHADINSIFNILPIDVRNFIIHIFLSIMDANK